MRRRRRWPRLVFGGAGLLAVGLVIYLAVVGTGDATPAYGGTYTEGVAGNPMAVNPLLSPFNDVDKDLVALVYSGLTKLDPTGQVTPDLAERWEVGPDGKTYTFYLRPDIKWHDGAPFNADDVIFTVGILQNPDFPRTPELASLWKGVTAKKVDESTVQLALASPFSPFLAYTTIGILPVHVWKDTPVKQLTESPNNANPIGTGPFVLKEITLEHALLEAYPDHYAGKPLISNVEIRFYHDYQTAMNALKRREIRGLLLRPGMEESDLVELRKDKKLVLNPLQASNYSIIFLNSRSPFFSDKLVRQAMMYALDRDKMVMGAAAGQAVRADSPILLNSWASDPDIKKYPYNPDKARELLAQAGWKPGADGVLEKDGNRFRFSLMTNNDKTRISVGEEVVRQLRQVGIKAEFTAGGPTGLMREYVIPRRFDAVLYGWDNGYDPDAYAAWHSSQIKENGLNLASYSNEKMDRILEKARQAPNLEERKLLYKDFQAIFAEEMPSLPLYYPTFTYVQDDSVRGFEPDLLFEPSSRFYNIKDWYVNTKQGLRW